jgi:hypothetical protein
MIGYGVEDDLVECPKPSAAGGSDMDVMHWIENMLQSSDEMEEELRREREMNEALQYYIEDSWRRGMADKNATDD